MVAELCHQMDDPGDESSSSVKRTVKVPGVVDWRGPWWF